MAKQHFYSCVPAKVSLFNKMDGYDTFAHSDGITREQIETEFACIYGNKPTKDEIALIQKGMLPTVYCQFSPDGEKIIQSAVSFISSDYTGERSSYMVHSLVLNDDEIKEHIESPDAAAVNREAFKTDLTDFNLTSFESKPITDYPEVKVPTKKASGTAAIAEKYDMGMLKRVIYALIGIPCGKTKNLFISLPSQFENLSNDCLDFINSMLTVFPYHMRKTISFVTSVGDFSKYSAFKLKFIPENFPPIPTSKGITLKMGAKDYIGISDENIATNAVVVDFFYSLLTDNDTRLEFLEFCRYAVEHDESLKKISLKNLTNLVFLFKVLSGKYNEKHILPNDDAVYSYISVYDKSRAFLTDEYRARAMDYLKRYSDNSIAIPKNIFAKVCTLYADENETAKGVVMSVVLSLIHTDAMRDKLFNFIKSNYISESEKTKADAMQSVCSVYYGGFLQEQIIGFFKETFVNEPDDIRNVIIEKLLLTVRTPKIQSSVLGFIDEYYGELSEKEKDKFYTIYFEMLPEGDNLAKLMTEIVDKHIDEGRQKKVASFILKALAKNLNLCTALVGNCGFTEKTVAEKVFGGKSDGEVFDLFVSEVNKKPLGARFDTICEIWDAASDMNTDTADRFCELISSEFTGEKRYDLFELISAYDKIGELKSEVPTSAEFSDKLQNDTLKPIILQMLPTVFDVRRYTDGVAKLEEFLPSHKFITEAEQYSCIREYKEMLSCLNNSDGVGMIVHASKIEGAPIRKGAAEIIKANTKDSEFSPEIKFFLELACEYLKNDVLAFSAAGNVLRGEIMKRERANGTETDAEKLGVIVDGMALETVLKSGADIYAADITSELKESIVSGNSEISKYVSTFLSKYEKKGRKVLDEKIAGLNASEEYIASLKKSPAPSKGLGGLFKRLF